ncbi:unnamed protein product [Oikopleura dioica]|uniref:Uncharacterized protein n=1 Tax=Oikopleura dioica TaxID=34765 RepID=E4YLI3_OIKDI|nr:unnamed protein product [Oikopleura dioica]
MALEKSKILEHSDAFLLDLLLRTPTFFRPVVLEDYRLWRVGYGTKKYSASRLLNVLESEEGAEFKVDQKLLLRLLIGAHEEKQKGKADATNPINLLNPEKNEPLLNSDKDNEELVTNVAASGADTDTFLAAYSGKDGKEGNGVEESNSNNFENNEKRKKEYLKLPRYLEEFVAGADTCLEDYKRIREENKQIL